MRTYTHVVFLIFLFVSFNVSSVARLQPCTPKIHTTSTGDVYVQIETTTLLTYYQVVSLPSDVVGENTTTNESNIAVLEHKLAKSIGPTKMGIPTRLTLNKKKYSSQIITAPPPQKTNLKIGGCRISHGAKLYILEEKVSNNKKQSGQIGIGFLDNPQNFTSIGY